MDVDAEMKMEMQKIYMRSLKMKKKNRLL